MAKPSKQRRTAALARSPSQSPPLSGDEDASGPPQPIMAEDALGPPPVPDAAEVAVMIEDSPAPVSPAATQPPDPPAAIQPPSELAQVLAALAAQAQLMARIQAEVKEQKAAAKVAAQAHAEEAHARALVAHDLAAKGRVFPVSDKFVSASSLIPDPVSPQNSTAPAGVSRASQVDAVPVFEPPAPHQQAKKRSAPDRPLEDLLRPGPNCTHPPCYSLPEAMRLLRAYGWLDPPSDSHEPSPL